MSATEKIPVLVSCDIGRDPDDALTMAYLAGSPEVEVVGVATTHMIPYRRAHVARAMMEALGMDGVPVGVGSVYPNGQGEAERQKYLDEHMIDGKTYEGAGLISTEDDDLTGEFHDAVSLTNELINGYGDRLRIAAIAPMTDLARAAQLYPEGFSRVGGVFVQGQALHDGNVLRPDPAAYNLKEDMPAAEAVLGFQRTVPFAFLGKHAAYQLPLERPDFEALAATGTVAGRYLKTHAELSIECFARRAPDIFSRVFKVPADQLQQLKELSKPYDVLVAKAISDPRGLVAETVGHHALIGMSPDSPGVADAAAVKADLMSTMLRALRSNQAA